MSPSSPSIRPPVNALSFNVRDGLFEGFKAAIAEPAAAAIVLICGGRTFIAGADISEFGGRQRGASLFEVQEMMESSPKPVVAAIHGTALGGGLEVALCAHYRIAVPSARCGLPEVNLGLLPGAGGTQRLPADRRSPAGAGDDDRRQPRAGSGVSGDGPDRRAGRRGHAAGRRHRLRPPAGGRGGAAGQDQRPAGGADVGRRLRGLSGRQRQEVPRLQGAGGDHPDGRGGGVAPVRRGPRGRAGALRWAGHQPGVGRPALCVLRRARGVEDPGRACRHPDDPGGIGRGSSGPAPWAAGSP